LQRRTDGTLEVLANVPNVGVFSRRFDTYGNQWRYATEDMKIDTVRQRGTTW